MFAIYVLAYIPTTDVGPTGGIEISITVGIRAAFVLTQEDFAMPPLSPEMDKS